ncbi:MAG TPA: FKBP-type peptidyl-prolyl cis-trans isomerase, partial [Anaeromyxobacteraceae bacterium]
MKVEKGSVVSVDYQLHFGDGKVVDASAEGEPMSYIHGEGQIVPGLERALEGLSSGDV